MGWQRIIPLRAYVWIHQRDRFFLGLIFFSIRPRDQPICFIEKHFSLSKDTSNRINLPFSHTLPLKGSVLEQTKNRSFYRGLTTSDF